MSRKDSDSNDPSQGESASTSAVTENTFMTESKKMFDDHKGKLAIGVAATLGVMIFYNWRERQLAKNDPEGHARLQRIKALVRTDETDAGHDKTRNNDNDGHEKTIASQVMDCRGAQEIATAR